MVALTCSTGHCAKGQGFASGSSRRCCFLERKCGVYSRHALPTVQRLQNLRDPAAAAPAASTLSREADLHMLYHAPGDGCSWVNRTPLMHILTVHTMHCVCPAAPNPTQGG